MTRFKEVRKKLGKWFSLPWYSILFGAYPVLALMAFNVGQIKMEAGWRPLLVSVIFAGIFFLLMRFILRDWNRAAFLSTLWMALFFSYGHVHIMLTERLNGVQFESWLLLAWFGLATGFVFLGVKRSPATPVTLNAIALGLVVMSVWQISSEVRSGGVHRVAAENAPVQENLTRPEDPPDVYYFILDSYTRADLLQEAYGYDNSTFLDALRERGFYVAECSQANYVRTEISVASSLNMLYLQDLDPSFKPENIGRRILWDSLKHNAARYNLEALGYKTVAFATGFAWSEWDDVDMFFTPPPFAAGMTEFETLFMQTTLARHAQDLGWVDADEIMGQNFRDRTLLVFDKMDDIARMPEPTFAYIHLISPHPPFVFGPNGEHTHPAYFWNEKKQYPAKLYEQGYQNQLTFLNKKILEAMDILLDESDTPPIVILQGDHGPWLQPKEKRMWILNAYHLPGHEDKLYPGISPVNTFRLIFDSYFGGTYGLLPDHSYFSPVPNLYEFSEIENSCVSDLSKQADE